MSFTNTTLKTAIQDYLESTETSFVSNLTTFITTAEERIFKNVQLDEEKIKLEISQLLDLILQHQLIF